MGVDRYGRNADLGRREFVKVAGAAAGFTILGAACTDSSPTVSEDSPIAAPAPTATVESSPTASPQTDDAVVPPGLAAVGVSGATDVESAVRRAIELAGGLGSIGPGDTVFIKPNAVHPFVDDGPGIVTSNDVLTAVINAVRDQRPDRVVVGDRAARGFDSSDALQASGQEAAALAAGADEVYAAPRPAEDPDAWVTLKPDGWEDTWGPDGGLLAMRRIVEADHFINVPVLKDHRWAVFSLSMKNLIGAVGDDTRDRMHYVSRMPDALSQDIVVLNQMFNPTMNVLDARGALVNGGPEGTGADAVRTQPGLVLASTDRVALDAVGAALLQEEIAGASIPAPDEAQPFLAESVWDIPQIHHAVTRGLGATGPEEIPLRFDQVPQHIQIQARLSA